jgi:hypothetical protein
MNYLCARTNDKQVEAYGENARRADKRPTKRIAVRDSQILQSPAQCATAAVSWKWHT